MATSVATTSHRRGRWGDIDGDDDDDEDDEDDMHMTPGLELQHIDGANARKKNHAHKC